VIKKQDIFFELACLTERSVSIYGLKLKKKWFKKSDKRYLAESLQKFIVYNQQLFDFLEVLPIIEGSGKDTRISFRSNHFIGAIPLRAPDNGKQIGDFVVRPRYTDSKENFSEYVELINLLQSDVPPEFKDSLPLSSNNSIKPPLYLESVKYIKLLLQSLKKKWHKFQNIEKIYKYPKPKVHWKNYFEHKYDPKMRLSFSSNSNLLSQFHNEFFEIKYVYNIAKKEIMSSRTPKNIKYNFEETLRYIDKILNNFESKYTKELKIHRSDPVIIKILKKQGNRILKANPEQITAWRIDFSVLFEKYIQYIFSQVSTEIGATQLNNYRIPQISKNPPVWSLHYLEPDLLIIKDNLNIIVDAKYKSHLFNLTSESKILKEEHRKDLHQLLAYSSFSENQNRICFLCYPTNKIICKDLKYFSKISEFNNRIILLGIPLKKSILSELKKTIIDKIGNIEKSIILKIQN